MILLTCAVAEELAFWRPRDDVATLVTGVGPVEASCALAAELCRRDYRLLVNAGLAGAFDGACRVGDGVVVTEDLLELDREDGTPLTLPREARTVERARSDAALAAGLSALGFSTVRGITVCRVTSSKPTARRLADERRAQVESMEGFAALRAAELAGVPAIEVRGVSNRCGERGASGWDFAAGISGLKLIVDALFGMI